MNRSEKLLFLIKYLLSENTDYKDIDVPESEDERFRLFRSLVNVRPSKPVSEEFLTVQDELLREKIAEKGVVNYKDLTPIKPHIYLWQGDITTLKCGAIVNAANSGMLGCFCPCHGCIDNAIHTFSGVQLRLECAEIMHALSASRKTLQGFEEPVGQAKITDAYNLPCDKVIHTVGPYVGAKLTNEHCEQLRSCYRECLKTAVQNGISSIAFCCISTGEFHFPNEKAAEIAVETVDEFLRENNNIEVIFNVFKDSDCTIYKRLLGGN
ncbi:MAG: protein-ADP-ribose hydrolase [Oscillospiraceae bacterium]|nr:protein-ADP-ribose hydrolase [Oscillospiraceae bacterium]